MRPRTVLSERKVMKAKSEFDARLDALIKPYVDYWKLLKNYVKDFEEANKRLPTAKRIPFFEIGSACAFSSSFFLA